MPRKPFFRNWKNIKNLSLGIVYVLFNLWIIFHDEYFPEPLREPWIKVLISYGLLNTLIISNADLRNKLFDVNFFKFIPRFFLYLIPFLFIFYFLLIYFDPLYQTSLNQLMQNVPLWLALIHALTFATTESIIWQGFLDEKVGLPWSSLIAGIFHYGIWEGTGIFVILSASLLFLFFSFIHWYFRKNNKDFAPVIACHTAFNLVKIGIFLSPAVI